MSGVNKLVYLATCYSKYPGGREEAYKIACRKAADLMLEGLTVFCPIAHSHSIELEGMHEVMDGDWWLKQDFAILDKCDALYVYKMPGWEQSYGIREEIIRAKWEGIPITYLEFEGYQLELPDEVST